MGVGNSRAAGSAQEQGFAARCIDLYKQHDMPLIANRLGVTVIEVSRTLRKARIVSDVQPFELSFIVEKLDAMPDRAISEHLGLSATQLDQILRRYGIRKKLKPERITLEVCIARTRWLIEERLRLPVNDQLPRIITNTHFTDHGLYPVISFASSHKADCPIGRHFSACAFLIGKLYPDRFKPWQFRHAKHNQFFSGKYGRRNFLDALLWLIDTKLCIAREALPYALENHSFLNARTLQDYGLGANWWRQLWSDKDEMLEAVAKRAGVTPIGHASQKAARARLKSVGIDVSRCAIPGCQIAGLENIQIHHIVRKATRVPGRFNVHATENLVPLCRHHHGIADRCRPTTAALRSPADLRSWLVQRVVAMTRVRRIESET